MPRTIDANLIAALASGSGKPIITATIGDTDGSAAWSRTPLRYKLTGTTLEFELPINLENAYQAMWLTRGVEIAGTQYTLETGRFFVYRYEYTPGTTIAYGELFPRTLYTANGNTTYRIVLQTFCAGIGKTAVFRNPAAAWLDYTFFPAGKSIILNHALNFLNLLQQKYLIFACDNGNEEVLFYDCADTLGAADFTYRPTADHTRSYNYHTARQFRWTDENGTLHVDGTATDPIHNLGYLESTAACPARHTLTWGSRLITRPDLSIMDGDTFKTIVKGLEVSNNALITEEYTAPDRAHNHPRWFTFINNNPVFHNTEGGAMPSTIERISNYTPLNTGMFNGTLSAQDNNLQAAMDTLDHHSHAAILPAHGLNGTVPMGTTFYTPFYYYGIYPSRFNFTLPKAGWLYLLSMWTNTAQPASGSLVVTVSVNNAASALTVTIPAGSPYVYVQDTANRVYVTAGTPISIDVQNNATAASAQINGLTVCLDVDNP